MEIDVVENPVGRLSEAINCHPTITAPEQSAAAEKVSSGLLLKIVQTVPDRVAAVECDRMVNPAAMPLLQAETDAEVRNLWCRDLLDALPAAIYTTDAAGRLTFFNRAAVEFSGRTPEIGSDQWCVTWRLYWPDGRPMAHDECPMARALKEDRPIRGGEAIAERPDGTRVPFMAYPTPLHDASSNLVGAVNMLVDLTTAKEVDEVRSLLNEMLEQHVEERTRQLCRCRAYQGLSGRRDYWSAFFRVLQPHGSGRRLAAAYVDDRGSGWQGRGGGLAYPQGWFSVLGERSHRRRARRVRRLDRVCQDHPRHDGTPRRRRAASSVAEDGGGWSAHQRCRS